MTAQSESSSAISVSVVASLRATETFHCDRPSKGPDGLRTARVRFASEDGSQKYHVFGHCDQVALVSEIEAMYSRHGGHQVLHMYWRSETDGHRSNHITLQAKRRRLPTPRILPNANKSQSASTVFTISLTPLPTSSHPPTPSTTAPSSAHNHATSPHSPQSSHPPT